MKKIFLSFLASLLVLGGCTLKSVISPSYDFDQINRVGIMSFSNTLSGMQGVENLFAKYLIQSGYKVVERAQLESILREHNISVSGYLSPKTTREIGRILGVDVLLIGEVSSYTPARTELTMTSSRRTETRPVVRQDVMQMPDGTYVGYTRNVGTRVTQSSDVRPTQYTINAQVGIIAKLVDVETAEIVWIGSDEESGASALDAADYIARRLVKSFIKEISKRQPEK
jgi:hypothetical protein